MNTAGAPCIHCQLYRGCTPEGLEFEPAVIGDEVATFVCPCGCHPDKPMRERLADERRRLEV